MVIFVTGASGFIGKYVIKSLLNNGYRVLASVRNIENFTLREQNLTVISGDFFNHDEIKKEIKSYVPRYCLNLAWEGIPDFSFKLCRSNLNYGLNLLEFCKDIGISTFIGFGSCWEYENPQGKVSEDVALSSGNSFKSTKNALRLMADAFCRENDMDFYWLRLFYVYGFGQRSGSLIPHIINSFIEGRQPNLIGAFNSNDFVYVQDVADAVVEVLKAKPEQRVLNIGTGKATRVIDILKIIAENMKINFLDLDAYTQKSICSSFWADLTKIRAGTSWIPRTSIEQGIKETVRSFIVRID